MPRQRPGGRGSTPRCAVMKPLSRYEKGFLEAAIDGEGSLTVYRRGDVGKGIAVCRLSISNTNLEFLEKCQEIIGAGTIVRKRQERGYEYRCRANSLRRLLPQLDLIIKRDRAEKMLEILGSVKMGANQHSYRYRERIEKKIAEFRALA